METANGGRVMKQPRKAQMREQLAGAADTIAAKNAQIDELASQLWGEGRSFVVGMVIGAVATLFAMAVGA